VEEKPKGNGVAREEHDLEQRDRKNPRPRVLENAADPTPPRIAHEGDRHAEADNEDERA
jgi:hypothetical protein